MRKKIRSENTIYNELLLAEEERQEISGLPILNIGDVVWRKECKDWDGAWVLVLTKEDMWSIIRPDPPGDSDEIVWRADRDRPEFFAYDVLCPDGRVMKFTDAVLRKEKPEC